MTTFTRADHRSSLIFSALAALTLAMTSGCMATPTGGGDNTEDAPPSSDAPASASACITPGAECLGTLDAGTHSTTVFQPGFSYTVPEGWQHLEEFQTSLLLLAPDETLEEVFAGTVTAIWVMSQAAAAQQTCNPGSDRSVETSVDAVVGHLQERTDIELSEPEQVEIGGLSGVEFDATQNPEEALSCEGYEGEPWTPIIAGKSSEDSIASGPLEGTLTRYVLLQHDDELLAITIDHDGSESDPVVDEVMQIVESLEFSL